MKTLNPGFIRTISKAPQAVSVASATTIPISAIFKSGASLTLCPVIPHMCFLVCNLCTISHLCSGKTSACSINPCTGRTSRKMSFLDRKEPVLKCLHRGRGSAAGDRVAGAEGADDAREGAAHPGVEREVGAKIGGRAAHRSAPSPSMGFSAGSTVASVSRASVACFCWIPNASARATPCTCSSGAEAASFSSRWARVYTSIPSREMSLGTGWRGPVASPESKKKASSC